MIGGLTALTVWLRPPHAGARPNAPSHPMTSTAGTDRTPHTPSTPGTPGTPSTPGTSDTPHTPVRISADPFSFPMSGQHASEAEPAAYGHDDTVAATFQVGRLRAGGSTAIGWAVWRHGVWRHGLLPGLTMAQTPPGPYTFISDPSVVYDAAHGLWLASSLAVATGTRGRPRHTAVVVSRSHDGIRWGGTPNGHAYILVSDSGPSFYDKDWITCDDALGSRYYGHCYAAWDRSGRVDQLLMSASTDGGATWSPPVAPADAPTGLGGQPVVQPDGTVIVPAYGEHRKGGAIIAFTSSDGGATWDAPVTVASVRAHEAAGGLRTEPLPSTAVDGAGRVYVAWQDCRFRPRCGANDIVLTSSTNGRAWSPVSRIPTDPIGGSADHFIPGLSADPTTGGRFARLGLTYYGYPNATCTRQTCALEARFVDSSDGGLTWSASRRLGGPMRLSWLPQTTGGAFVGDYIATAFTGHRAVAIFPLARPPLVGFGRLDQAMDAAFLPVSPGTSASP